jgi:hypothetical protein
VTGLIWVSADEVIAGDRVFADGSLRTVITVQADLDRPGTLLINHDSGTYATPYERDVQIAPNPHLGECDDLTACTAQSRDEQPVSHVRAT